MAGGLERGEIRLFRLPSPDVIIRAVGVKLRNRVIIGGEEVDLR